MLKSTKCYQRSDLDAGSAGFAPLASHRGELPAKTAPTGSSNTFDRRLVWAGNSVSAAPDARGPFTPDQITSC